MLPTETDRGFSLQRYAGVPNITECINFNNKGVKSYWFANFLHGDNGHDYCLVFVNANVYPRVLTSVSMMDITAKTYYGESFWSTGKVSTTTLAATSPGHLDIFATSPDHFSNINAISVVPNATFNLSYVAQGPNFYQGATGSYVWGTDVAYAFDNPETLPSGTLMWEGKEVKVVSEKSKTWFDIQWGPGYAYNGWYSFTFLLDNGVRVVTMTTGGLNVTGYRDSIVTFGYLDGHHEVYAVDTDYHPSNPWKSARTNITYYSNYEIHVPGKAWFNVSLPVEGGELTHYDDPTPANSIADSFAYFTGVLDGKKVKGVGIAERKVVHVSDP